MYVKSDSTPALFNAETVSPPPATEISWPSRVNFATVLASSFVPRSNGTSSNTPSGPFQRTVLAFANFSSSIFDVSGPTSKIFQSPSTSFIPTNLFSAFALNSFATQTSIGRIISQPFFFASSIIFNAVSVISGSAIDAPMLWPWASKNVFAIAPPITKASTFFVIFLSTASFVETFEPPTIAIAGCAGFSNAFVSALISSSIKSPAYEGKNFVIPSVEAWARCDVENASFTYTSPSDASFFENSASFASSSA